MAPDVTFQEFQESLSDLAEPTGIPPAMRARLKTFAAEVQALEGITVEALAGLVRADPSAISILGACVGLSHEALQNQLRLRLKAPNWRSKAKSNPELIVEALDDGFGLVARLERDRVQAWSFSDILVERYASRARGGRSVTQGRGLENKVEEIARALGLSYAMRCRFEGRGGETGPCDLAIPAGGKDALIVVAVKGFNATGSKLTDTFREVEAMASVRRPTQFVFVVIDGIGWLRRTSDLTRIYDLWSSARIDGLYSLRRLDSFSRDLAAAARRLSLTA